MANLYLNPHLPNYFRECADLRDEGSANSQVLDYEDGKVITFPNWKIDIDTKFWSSLDTEKHHVLKKFRGAVSKGQFDDVSQHRQNLRARDVDEALADEICEQFRSVYAAVLPVYRKIFSDYDFTGQKVVWRLNTIRNENMHVDAYKEENDNHFARMFINLDDQPRIWQTSWTIHEMMKLAQGLIPAEKLAGMDRGQIWAEINKSVFGRSSSEWWDSQPRHVCYFDPGEAWIVDSRQVAHQIFYGRRALSIDFSLPRASMLKPEKHYLQFAEQFRDENLHLSVA